MKSRTHHINIETKMLRLLIAFDPVRQPGVLLYVRDNVIRGVNDVYRSKVAWNDTIELLKFPRHLRI